MFVCALKCGSELGLSFSDLKKLSIYVLRMSLFLLILRTQYIDISNSQHVDEGTIDIYI